MEDILCPIETARLRLWLSEREALLHAGANPHPLPDARRGNVPSVERVRAVCDALGLAFYAGLPRLAAGAGPLAHAAGVDRQESDQLKQATRAFARAGAARGRRTARRHLMQRRTR